MELHGTIEKASELLFFLNAQREACGVSSIASALKLPKSSVHRLLQSLRHRNLVEQDGRGRYQLGVGLIPLGLGAAEGDPLIRTARPILEQWARALGETFFVVTVRGGALVILDREEGSGFLRASPRVGAEVPTHATAVGKLYLALAPELVRKDPTLRAYTRRTICSEDALRTVIGDVRRRGYAESQEEWMEGLSAVAAPIQARGRMVGAFVTATISQRWTQVGPELVSAVQEGARQVSGKLEGTN